MPPPEDSVNTAELAQYASRAIAFLPARNRETVRLRLYEDLSFGEIGELTNCLPDTARMLFNRSIASVRDRIAARSPAG